MILLLYNSYYIILKNVQKFEKWVPDVVNQIYLVIIYVGIYIKIDRI